jgi:hypothetical protein
VGVTIESLLENPDLENSLVSSLKDQIRQLTIQINKQNSSPSLDENNSIFEPLVEMIFNVIESIDKIVVCDGSNQNDNNISKVQQNCLEAKVALRQVLGFVQDRIKYFKVFNTYEKKTNGIENELLKVRQELDECREDLKRDEDIFAEKVKELKYSKIRIRELEMELSKSHAKNEILHSQIGKISSKYIKFAQIESKPEYNIDDLDISIAVVNTEPDISQLMEDIEAIAKEKDDLVVNNFLAEEKVLNVSNNAIALQKQLKEQLSALESNILSKEQIIKNLLISKHNAQDLVEKYEFRIGGILNINFALII